MPLTNSSGQICSSLIIKELESDNIDKIQAAKDFIWQYLEPHNQALLILDATTDSLARNNLIVDKIIIGFQYKNQ